MKKYTFIIALSLLFCAFCTNGIFAQTFQKGSLLVSISEGTTQAHFATNDESTGIAKIKDGNTHGDRDPLIVEYGLTNKWGIGINIGGDILHTKPNDYYKVKSSANTILTSETSIEGNYHFFLSEQLDLAAGLGLGISSVKFSGSEGDGVVRAYNATGPIARLSAKAHYYFFRRLGAVAIVSAYTSSCSPSDCNGNNSIAKNTTSNIQGYAVEFGLCYRILR